MSSDRNTKLVAVLQKQCVKERAQIGIGYKSLSSNGTAFIHPDMRFAPASVFKIFVLIDLYRRILDGHLSPSQGVLLKDSDRSLGSGVLQYVLPGAKLTIRDYARLMMIISDNTAADVLFDLLGRESVADTISWLGLRNTKVYSNCKDLLVGLLSDQKVARLLGILEIDSFGKDPDDSRKILRKCAQRVAGIRRIQDYKEFWSLDDIDDGSVSLKRQRELSLQENYTTPRDLVTTFEKIFKERILGEFTDEVMQIMAACETGQNRIRKGIPAKSLLIHKTGTIPGVTNDVGMVVRDSDSYILAVLVKDIPVSTKMERTRYVREGERIIAQVSKAVSTTKNP